MTNHSHSAKPSAKIQAELNDFDAVENPQVEYARETGMFDEAGQARAEEIVANERKLVESGKETADEAEQNVGEKILSELL